MHSPSSHPGVFEPRRKEEWKDYVLAPEMTQLVLPSWQEYQAMDEVTRYRFNRDRDDQHSALVLTWTPRVAYFDEQIDVRLRANKRAPAGAKQCMLISGPGTVGKSTMVKVIARKYELQLRRFEPELFEDRQGNDFVPVVYLTLDDNITTAAMPRPRPPRSPGSIVTRGTGPMPAPRPGGRPARGQAPTCRAPCRHTLTAASRSPRPGALRWRLEPPPGPCGTSRCRSAAATPFPRDTPAVLSPARERPSPWLSSSGPPSAMAGGGRRTVAVLGEMAELGEAATQAHRDAGRLAARLGIGVLVTVGGDNAAAMAGAARSGGLRALTVHDADAALSALASLLRPGDIVLAKASHAMHLEDLAVTLAGTGRPSA